VRISFRSICWFVAIVSAIGGVGNFVQGRDDRAFAKHGLKAIAKPVKVEQATRTKYGKVTSVTTYADLEFKTESGEPATTHLTVPDDLVQAVSGGMPVEIDYLPEHPSTARFPGWKPTEASDTGIALLAFLAAVAGLWFRRNPD